ncbi:glycine receptor subunit alpha-4-like [Branchiostoma floridae x Branchiostoma belcheri]
MQFRSFEFFCSTFFLHVCLLGLENYANAESHIHIHHENDSLIAEHVFETLENYDGRVRPDFGVKPTEVQVQLYIASLGSISEIKMDYTMTFYLRQWWNDPRFEFPDLNQNIELHNVDSRDIWTPSIYFVNEKDAGFRPSTDHAKALWIWPSGDIFYGEKKTVIGSCPMQFHMYPFDSQTCTFQIASYGYTTKDLIIEWVEPAVEFNPVIELPEYVISGWTSRDCTGNYTIGSFSCIEVKFTLVRQLGFYLIQTYVPSILIVCLSWLTFWISPNQAPARVALGITTVLTATTLTTVSRSSLPKFSYIRSIDIWMLVCTIYVFAALVEFSLAYHFSLRKDRVRPLADCLRIPRSFSKRKSTYELSSVTVQTMKANGRCSRVDGGPTEFQTVPGETPAVPGMDGMTAAVKLDLFSKIGFPLTFIIFNGFYWGVYLSQYSTA